MPIPPEAALPFLAASLLLAIAPGPDNIFVLTQSAIHGRSAGLCVTAGLCTGLIGHSTAVAFGVAALFQASALAFTLLKFAGAGYLLYLAWQALRAGAGGAGEPGAYPAGRLRLYGRGVVMNITNPKVSLFFLAFLPPFADPGRGPVWVQILLLGALFILATILVFGSISLLAGSLGQWLSRSPKVRKILNRAAGAVFLGLAVKLVTSKR
jgi:threonine/homoserine/homoserine lactone efflux protein